MQRRVALKGIATVLASGALAGCNDPEYDLASRAAPTAPKFQPPSEGSRCASPGEHIEIHVLLKNTSDILLAEGELVIPTADIRSDPPVGGIAQRKPPIVQFTGERTDINATIPVKIPASLESGTYKIGIRRLGVEQQYQNLTIHVGECTAGTPVAPVGTAINHSETGNGN